MYAGSLLPSVCDCANQGVNTPCFYKSQTRDYLFMHMGITTPLCVIYVLATCNRRQNAT